MTTDVEILLAARRRIERKQERFICCAIYAVRVGTIKQKADLKAWVMASLDGFPTYDSWVRRRYPKLAAKVEHNDFREARLAWIDWMIKQVKS